MAALHGKTRRTSVVFGGVGSATVVAFLLIHLGVLPRVASQVLLLGIVAGWLAFGVWTIVRRFGWRAVVTLTLLALAASTWIWYWYQNDLPKRQLVAQIEGHRGVRVTTKGMDTGSPWTGDIYYLYFESSASEHDVRQILKLPGLNTLERLVFKGTSITDATLAVLATLPNLRDIYIEDSNVTDAGIDRLITTCPNCTVEIR